MDNGLERAAYLITGVIITVGTVFGYMGGEQAAVARFIALVAAVLFGAAALYERLPQEIGVLLVALPFATTFAVLVAAMMAWYAPETLALAIPAAVTAFGLAFWPSPKRSSTGAGRDISPHAPANRSGTKRPEREKPRAREIRSSTL